MLENKPKTAAAFPAKKRGRQDTTMTLQDISAALNIS
jgi:hypothetical protein